MNKIDSGEPRGPMAHVKEHANDVEIAQQNHPYRWTAIGTVLGLALLYIALRKTDLSSLGSTLQSTSLRWASVVVASQLVFVAFKSWRWGLLLRFVRGISFQDLQSAVYAGLAINYVLAHVGEFFRAIAISRKANVPVSTIIASVVVERVFDFIALLLLVAFAAYFAQDLPDVFSVMSIAILSIVVAAIVCLALLMSPPTWGVRLISMLAKPLPEQISQWLANQSARFRHGLISLRSWRLILVAILASLFQWFAVVFLIWGSTMAVGGLASLIAAIVTLLLVVVGQQLPNSPLQVGTTQLAFMIGLGIDGVPATTAVAASLIFTVFAMVPTMLIGGAYLMQNRKAKFVRVS